MDRQKPNLIDEMKAKIDIPQGKKIYARHLGIVEPMFANICVQKHMNRFTLHTESKVDAQWRLLRWYTILARSILSERSSDPFLIKPPS